MKQFTSETLLVGLVLATALIITGCASTGGSTGNSVSRSSNSAVQVNNPNLDLTDYLRRIPGVLVSGSGATARVTIRGVNTFIGVSDPLYVLNGVRIGRSFGSVYAQVNMYDVSSIEVLKGPEASVYGVQGGNGVVLINYKQ